MEKYKIELSPSNRTVCLNCNQIIKTGTLRLKKFLGIEFGHNRFRFFCRNCAKKILHKELCEIEKLLMIIKRWK